jgi:uncharacterized protein (TIGR02271 family)
MAEYTIVTAFPDRHTVGQVDQELRRAGVVLNEMEVIDRSRGDVAAHLRARSVLDADARHYAQEVAQGRVLLVGYVDAADMERAVDILDNYGPVEQRDPVSTAASQMRDTDAGGPSRSPNVADTTPAERSSEPPLVGERGAEREIAAGGETVIPVTEEQLQVGKRTVQRGGVRVRTYVVETPVEEPVRLRDETVRVERRAIDSDRPASEADFQERTVEVTETDEEAVVAKSARVTEEVVISKDVQERTEPVRETVRRTEVEVDDRTTDRGSDRIATERSDLPTEHDDKV